MEGEGEARRQHFAYSDLEVEAARTAAERSLAEDLTERGDITTGLFSDMPSETVIEVAFIPRHDGVLAGTRVATEVFALIDEDVVVNWHIGDGERLVQDRVAGVVTGAASAILAGERSALNSLCHLSGIATLTSRFVSLIESVSPSCQLRDTRKTLPGLRILEKAAVRAGGGLNHRAGLSDAVLIKDNHIAAFMPPGTRGCCELDEPGELGSHLLDLVVQARTQYPDVEIEIEADTIGMVELAVAAGADTVLCDNMTSSQLEKAVEIARGRCKLEASGGVTLDNVVELAATGVDYIAVGAVTHSAAALDIGLDLLGPELSKGT